MFTDNEIFLKKKKRGFDIAPINSYATKFCEELAHILHYERIIRCDAAINHFDFSCSSCGPGQHDDDLPQRSVHRSGHQYPIRAVRQLAAACILSLGHEEA